MAVNPRLEIDWPPWISDGECTCGARYAEFRHPTMPRDARKRFTWAKRQLRPAINSDADVYWSRRSILWILRWCKATEFIATHRYCNDLV